ncbi:hypothetical protein GGX14DRAFT_389605 [Mycena pura]|uniref:Uncharacterized protein n=1 Tax=Mycena pura TaxID=153505 RepID=A0AAD6VQV8_9AGAR|nr:hypothetical protein GGX14DRAFT_389605 [Mycena pura]
MQLASYQVEWPGTQSQIICPVAAADECMCASGHIFRTLIYMMQPDAAGTELIVPDCHDEGLGLEGPAGLKLAVAVGGLARLATLCELESSQAPRKASIEEKAAARVFCEEDTVQAVKTIQITISYAHRGLHCARCVHSLYQITYCHRAIETTCCPTVRHVYSPRLLAPEMPRKTTSGVRTFCVPPRTGVGRGGISKIKQLKTQQCLRVLRTMSEQWRDLDKSFRAGLL